MGQLGEGVASLAGKPVFIPYVLPGEAITARIDGTRAMLDTLETPSAERIAAFCPHFGRCGGCALQHWNETAYRAWKRGLLVTALQFERLDPPVADLIDAHGEGRRRVKLHARTITGRQQAGFMAARSHEVVDLDQCPILVPALAPAMAVARDIGRVLAETGKPLGVQVTATRTGLDVDIGGVGAIDLRERLQLGEVAQKYDLARLSLHGDLVAEQRPPILRFGEVDVVLPPGGFTQATEAGEAALAGLVEEAAKGAGVVADLFCGIGPFGLRLSGSARIHAVDSAGAAVAALKRAHDHHSGLKSLTSEVRDLFQRPLLAAELKRFDLVIFDPPRAGAQAQADHLATSAVPAIVAVSCNPASFARDAGILVRAGYRLEAVTPVDQFKWSPHLEIVGVFRRS